MSRLEAAIQAAEDRKTASLGDDASGLVFSSTEMQDRAVFGGFDLDYDELLDTATRVGNYFTGMASGVGLHALFLACWLDGMLTGLLAASLRDDPPESEAATGSGGEGE